VRECAPALVVGSWRVAPKLRAPTSAAPRQEGWMISGQETLFLLSSSSVANTGNQLVSCVLFKATANQHPPAHHPLDAC
jgi:hypothetical protein